MGDAFDETHNDMANLRGEYVQQKEEQVRSRETARQRERRRDTELWEENRLIVSGVIKREASLIIDEEEEIGRTHLLVSYGCRVAWVQTHPANSCSQLFNFPTCTLGVKSSPAFLRWTGYIFSTARACDTHQRPDF